MADDGKRTTGDELKDALEQLKKAADKVADKILGSEVTQHLRGAAQHVVRAARTSLDELDRKMGEKRAKDDAGTKAP